MLVLSNLPTFFFPYIFGSISKEVKWSEVAQSCLTLYDPKDCSLPGSFVHGILQARVLEWGAIAFSLKEMSSLQRLKRWESREVNMVLRMKVQVFQQIRSYENGTEQILPHNTQKEPTLLTSEFWAFGLHKCEWKHCCGFKALSLFYFVTAAQRNKYTYILNYLKFNYISNKLH